MGGENKPSNIIVLCAPCHQIWHRQNGADHHNYLVKEGIAKAQANGVHVGKPQAPYEKVMRLIAENSTQFNQYSLTTEREIMAMAGVKDVCYYRCKRMLLSAIKADVWPYEWEKPKQVRSHPEYEHVILKMRGA